MTVPSIDASRIVMFFKCCTDPGKDSDGEALAIETSEKRKGPCWCRALKWTVVIIFIILILVFITIFCILPLVFKYNIGLQRFVMFPNVDDPDNPEYENYALYGTKGARNFYIPVSDIHNNNEKISLGVWQLVPESVIPETEDKSFDYEKALRESVQPVLLYFHGNTGNRILALDTYEVIRKYFHILAFDYRGYGDSTDALLTEKAVVDDSRQVYEWLRSKTNQELIYVWGHSLGSALSTHTLKSLKENKDLVPAALILEAPFSTMREEIFHHPAGKWFNWLPWFESTILDPLEENEFLFRTTTNILSVDCPIMVMHAIDDRTIPYTLGKKVVDVATTQRTQEQGNVTYHEIDASYNCGHSDINTHPDLRRFISDFMDIVNCHRKGGC